MSFERIAVLLGNGPNRLSESVVSWGDVLNELMHMTPYLRDAADGKPFPLLFEEIALHFARNDLGNDGDLKRMVAEKVASLSPNSVHHRLLALGVKHILTTNYDYALEKAADPQGESVSKIETTERKHSLFRVRRLQDGTNIWHIHGEGDKPSSLTLGFGHYTSYLSNLHRYTHGDGIVKPASLFIRGIDWETPNKKGLFALSWIDIFLRNHVFVIGLGLGFEEIDLWWAITLKERLRNKFGNRVGKTVYYQFSIDGSVDAKCASLLSLGVDVVHVEVDGDWDYPKAYNRIVSDIFARSRFKRQKKYLRWTHTTKPTPIWLPM